MENSAEAIKMAGFTLLFVTALSIAMITVMQAKHTSETIIGYSDKTKYYSEIGQTNAINDITGNRKLSVYDIIPTLYRYDKEQYIVIFENLDQVIKFNGYIKNGILINGDTANSKLKNYIKDIHYLNADLEANLEFKWMADYKGHVDYVVKQLISEYKDKRKLLC